MAFPETPLDVTVELQLDGTWTDITGYVYDRDGGISITRGRADEATVVEPSSCQLSLNNTDGRFSPRNPTGPYYGQFGRNTPVRVRQGATVAAHLALPATTSLASTPDSASVSVTGDIDIRIDVEPDDWAAGHQLAFKFGSFSGDQRSWAFAYKSTGNLWFAWSANGSTVIQATSTATVAATGRKALRVTLDVDNGAAGRDVKFYTADTITGSWTQLGTTVTTAGVTSVFDSTTAVELGNSAFYAADFFPVAEPEFIGRIHRFQLFASINGTDERADADFTTAEAGSGPVADEHGFDWTLTDATVVDPAIRFVGELSSLPQVWDPTGTDVWSPAEASGILRRLGQGSDSLRSAIHRATLNLAGLVAYWPCEDESEATFAASAISGASPMAVTSGSPTFASYEAFAGSDALLVVGDAIVKGSVPAHTATGESQVRFMMNIPAETDNRAIATISTTGTARTWKIVYRTTGDLQVLAYDGDEAVLLTSGVIPFNLDGLNCEVALELEQDGSDVDWTIRVIVAGVAGVSATGSTIAGATLGRVTEVTLNPDRTLETMAIGHVAVTSIIDILPDIGHDALVGYAGETAARRIARLCGEEGVNLRFVGDPDESQAMGPQTSQILLDLLREAETSDGGVLYEQRDSLGLAYRTRASLYNQDASLTLDYAGAELSMLLPVDDDQNTRNDVTVSREGGSSARYTLEEGPLSIQAPPNGVGRYDEQIDVSHVDDSELENQAGWRVHLGTVDETRYPQVAVQLSRPAFVNDAELAAAVKNLNIGDRLVIENPPAWLPPGDISQLAQGFSETMGNFVHDVTVNCSPASPWDVGTLDHDTLGRLDTDGSELALGVDSDDTALSVAVTDGPLWTTDGAEFPLTIKVGGERMIVTAISGVSSPQTFTVTRSANGVVKAHSSGADVRLDQPMILSY